MLNARLRTVWLANVATATAAVAVGAGPLRSQAAHRVEHAGMQRDSVIAADLEVVTVTDRSVILTWTTRTRDRAGRLRPTPADTEVRIAPAEGIGPARTVLHDTEPTAYHYAQIDGLEPGRSYRFEAYSNGRRAVSSRTLVTRRAGSPETTGVVTTLIPPPGRLLRTLALANDLHVGEQTSGLLMAGLPTGLRHEDAEHPELMLEALLADLRLPDRGADQLIVAGDLTDCGTLEQSLAVRGLLDAWGELGRDYFVCRGNHDAPQPDDHWGAVFHPRQRLTENEVGGLRLIGLDTTRLRGSGGTIVGPQLAHLRDRLAADPDRPTLVFGHHPVTSSAAVSNPGGPGFVLDRATAARVHAAYRNAPGVFLHHCGHTHRNRLGRPDSDIDVEFLEVAAAKEYPGGYMLLRVYEGGYMVNFYKTRTEAARRWSTRTRRQYFGLHPDHALGACADRNHVVLRDFSGLAPA
ncbi:metallophosphoesterase [Nocardia pseudobrasiliensis]|uniref:Calcineurin-like phosphoesterase family protein n=1 Tax=Nocardia pseudobrasiliensis TaxID=45979 RepID=A0A370I001_9NOCA|nr:metallophosphoesterase [Nocardia pseudobrasiliensis]RDI64075.1 calcineurin-like phosphoesterase family protein [Nocardia pseudobrasiliensis]